MAKFSAVIDRKCERYGRWLAGFGTDRVPVVSPMPSPQNLIGTGKGVPCYMIDLGRLEPATLARVVDFMAREHAESPEAVRAEVLEFGLPLIALDVTIVSGD